MPKVFCRMYNRNGQKNISRYCPFKLSNLRLLFLYCNFKTAAHLAAEQGNPQRHHHRHGRGQQALAGQQGLSFILIFIIFYFFI
jgi:hypothetical protein